MAYILNKTDGTALVTVLDNATTGTDYSVTFIGKNYLPYGETLNESLLHLLENSASTTTARPINPVIGQTWYNKTDKTLYVCYQERAGTTPAQFRALAKSNVGSGTPVDPSVGDLWFDSVEGVLKAYSGATNGWVTIGPTPQPDWTQTDGTRPNFIKNKPLSFTPDLSVKNSGTVLSPRTTAINFIGSGVTASLVSGTTNNIDVSIIGGVSVSSTAPTNPATGSLWYENASVGRGFIYDGTSWVDFSPQLPAVGSSAPTLPATNATGYLYNNGTGTITWSAVSTAAPVTALSALTDVDATGVAVGNVLTYTSVSGVSKWRPVATSTPTPTAAASTSFTLATTDGSAKSMGVVLTPGTWQVILDTRLTITNDYNHNNELTQIATVGSVTVTTSLKTNRGGGAGHGRFIHMSDVAVGEFTLTVDTAIVMAMQAAVPGTGAHTPVGSTLTVSKIASTDAQNIYSGTMPTFTPPSASGLGVGQTWKNVTANRAVDTLYTNNTSAPIFIAIGVYRYNDSVQLLVDSMIVGYCGGVDGGSGQLTAVVPVGSTYKINGVVSKLGGNTIASWAELS
jgi:hypothetical protein